MGARTDAARAEVLTARQALSSDLDGLEASAREAIDIPAHIRRAPARAAGLAGGAAFLALGGPRRVFRRARRAVFGPEAALPSSMLPDEIETVLRTLGTDGAAVRARLEREFAGYLDKRGSFAEREIKSASAEVAAGVIRQAGRRLGRRLIDRFLS